MKYKTVTLFTLTLMLCLSPQLFAGDKGGGKHFVFNLVGTGYQYASTVPDPESGADSVATAAQPREVGDQRFRGLGGRRCGHPGGSIRLGSLQPPDHR